MKWTHWSDSRRKENSIISDAVTYMSHAEQWWQRSGLISWHRSQYLMAAFKWQGSSCKNSVNFTKTFPLNANWILESSLPITPVFTDLLIQYICLSFLKKHIEVFKTLVNYCYMESISIYSLPAQFSCPSPSGNDLSFVFFHLWREYLGIPLWNYNLSVSQLSTLAFSILFSKQRSSRLFSKLALPHFSKLFLNKPSSSSQWKQDTSTVSLKGGGKPTPTAEQNC